LADVRGSLLLKTSASRGHPVDGLRQGRVDRGLGVPRGHCCRAVGVSAGLWK